MLLACKTPEELDISKLLAIYRSDSLENCRSMYPEEPTVEAALALYEAGYAAFMRSEFFARPGRLWMVETEDGPGPAPCGCCLLRRRTLGSLRPWRPIRTT